MFRINQIALVAALGFSSIRSVTCQKTTEAVSSIAVYSTTSSSTTSSSVPTHTVLIGKADHKVQPDVVQAAVGDMVQFNFYPANHSVVRAEYLYPCIPYEMTGADKVEFFSGFQPVDAILDDPPTYTIRINDSLPIFFYCSAPGSCINYQMVGVINPNKSVSLDAHKQRAAKSSFMLNPGEKFPDEAASSSALAPQSSVTSPTTSALPGSEHEDKGLSGGAIAGIVIGAVAAIAVLAALFFFVGRNKSLKERVGGNSDNVNPQGPQMYQSPYQSPGGAFSRVPQHDPYFGNGGNEYRPAMVPPQTGGPPLYSPSNESGHRGYFTEVGVHPSTLADGMARTSEAGSPPPQQAQREKVHEMAG
ncbi:uncharacterized protein K452DRAFT_315280 [Aplosporella prunicola CBS 121167]|uniref:Extracellular serine-rich protein n=1 Tax=Aplosporella prunicola CBS 121167 TaxID=1176127 RepID=A0A6A6BRU9_9PEZI|nr:uncharacterized protein K452DRAFT_315280 [Aplosporella prunicola CBS 121167]KAF2146015.1 hypothetical protein K452DRAFT_315280 [Aplosporella prunicola CBS 121167]